MRRTVGGAFALTMALAMIGTAAVASPYETRTHQFVYAAGDGYVIGPDLTAHEVWVETGVGTAPMGRVSFVAASDRITITLDDATVTAGSVWVGIREWVGQARDPITRGRCIAVDQPTLIDGLVPGGVVHIEIPSDLYLWPSCDHGATAGVITVEGALRG